MTRLLILGSSHAELPLVDAALKLGSYVATVSSGTPGPAAMRSHQHYRIDYSEAVLVENLVREEMFSSLVAGCNDFAAFTVSQVAHRLGMENYDSPQQTKEIHLKDRFRMLCSRLMIPSPRFFAITKYGNLFGDQLKKLTFPVIVKPIDLTGGKGIRVCERPIQVGAAVEAALSESRSKRVVVEELIQGQLRSACFFLIGGRPVLLTHAMEYLKRDTFLVESALAPSDLSSYRISRLTNHIEDISKTLELQDGVLHVQFISYGEEDYLVEACRRPPGDLYLLLPTHVAEHEIADLIIRNALRQRINLCDVQQVLSPTLRLCLMPPRNGHIKDWSVNSLRDVSIAQVIKLRSQDTSVVDYRREKLGIVFLVGNSSSLTAIAENPETVMKVNYW